MKTVIITGGSSGIGLATAGLFAENGFSVYELSRSGKDNGAIKHIDCDVTDEESVRAAFARVFELEGRLDILVNNAGFGISGAVEFTSLEQAKKQFEVNFFGVVSCSDEAVGYMRKNGGGTIVNVSSLAAPLSIPFQAFYSASKSAVNSLTLAMANELRPFNIKVCAVMPGDVKTGFTAAREKSTDGDEIYSGILQKSVSTMEHDEQNGMAPISIAKTIYKLATAKNPKPLSTVGFQYKFLVSLAKILPIRAVNRIIGIIYAK
ncbi:MAG: SDR family oxidoreductase [Oscillospiraceae bacterium]|nr:SDR family oxidoreductase [Oscillospiraceae bacterium]